MEAGKGDEDAELSLLSQTLDLQKAERSRMSIVAKEGPTRAIRKAARAKVVSPVPVAVPAEQSRMLRDAVALERKRGKRAPSWTLEQMGKGYPEWQQPAAWQRQYADVAQKWVGLHG